MHPVPVNPVRRKARLVLVRGRAGLDLLAGHVRDAVRPLAVAVLAASAGRQVLHKVAPVDHALQRRPVGGPEEHAGKVAVEPPLVHADRGVVEVVVDVDPGGAALVDDAVQLAGELADDLAGQHGELAVELADELAVEEAALAVHPAGARYQVALLVGVVAEHLAGERAAVRADYVVGRQAVVVPDVVGVDVQLDAQLVVGADLGGDPREQHEGGKHRRDGPHDERRCDEHHVQAPACVHVRDQAVDRLGDARAPRPAPVAGRIGPVVPPRHCPFSPPPPAFPGLKPLPPGSLLGNISSYGSSTRAQKSSPLSVT